MLKRLTQIALTFLCVGIMVDRPAHAQTPCPEPNGSEIIENYCYDALGRLVAVTRNDGTSEDLAYDAASNRVSRAAISVAGDIVVVNIGGRPMPIVVD
ncbi:MAG: RHS repeat protein [Sphingomonadales bacterium]|nr:RHS repeat protein [Sphingomonadales bacterium]